MIYQLDFSFRAEADAGIARSEYDKKLPGLSFRFFDELNFFIQQLPKIHSLIISISIILLSEDVISGVSLMQFIIRLTVI